MIGATFSLICYVLIGTYGAYQMSQIFSFGNSNFSQNTINNYFTEDDFFYPIAASASADSLMTGNFTVAFGLLLDDFENVPNMEQYFHVSARSYAYVSQPI